MKMKKEYSLAKQQKIRRMMDELDVDGMSEFYRRKIKDKLGV